MKPEEIKAIRKSFGKDMTQEHFASLVGTTVVTINRWERGKTKPSNAYVRSLKEIRGNHASYACRRRQPKES